ncbi:EAL domain-containing protein [Bradyrhizobium sp. UNPF46]|uniref:putative bifunctional diguanylate cyclase/phosphodiesterase n=1 Tax=Bradyrhizobium sp. UNPF46 TaxID=1141168 RepID=UPI00114E2EFC|nr:EAL domain-containing protein [Bradyrhizobium sp. UNPF46]
MHSLGRSERIGGLAGFVLLLAAAIVMQIGTGALAAYVALLCVGLVWLLASADRPKSTTVLDHAIESVPAGLCVFAADLRVIASNQQFASMYGLTRADVKPGTRLRQITEARRAKRGLSESVVDAIHGFDAAATSVHELRDGRFISVSRHPMAGGGLVEVHRDVTGERLAEIRANETMQELIEKQYAIDQAVIVAITDVKGVINYVNDNFCSISGYSREELIGQNHRILKSGVHSKELFRDMYRCLAGGHVWRGELCNLAKSGRLYWVDTVITPQLGPDGKPVAYMAIRVDITARKEAEAKLSFAATHDSLTGLLNRCALFDQAGIGPEPDVQPDRLGVHLIDLDGFKRINDTFGHDVGDHLLKAVASRLRSLATDRDLVARLGGDEFAMIRRVGDDAYETAQDLGRRIVDVMAAPFEIEGHQLDISASVGIVLCPEHGSSSADLLKKADLALYEVKAAGRDGHRLYQPAMLEAIKGEKVLEAELRRAISAQEFELHYQPILDVESRTVHTAEALVRWRHPVDGLVAPDRFIALAERTGLIQPLSEWIIQRACLDAVSWPPHVQLAVNVSATQFKRGDLFDVVLQALLRSGLNPRRLQIEVTETVLLEQQSEQLQTFRRLKSMGVTLVLDDFGTGFSSASYLTNFPFDKIKIDKSFIQGLSRRECAAVIASAVVLAKGLGISVTAEGIETEPQLEHVRSMGIDFAQGYLFGRPVPYRQFKCAAAIPDDSGRVLRTAMAGAN